MQKINVALCSFGMSGKIFHAPFIYQHPGFCLYAIVERSANKSAEIYDGPVLYRSVEEMLQDDAVQYVVVNTPVRTHFEYAKKALEAGKHVIVEKPFTVAYVEAVELAELAAAKQLHLTVYQNRRYDADFLALKNIIQSNKIGRIKEAELRFNRYRPALSLKQHKETNEQGNGILYDLGSHIIDQALALFGMPLGVFADTETMREQSLTNDYFELILRYDGFRARVTATFFAYYTAYDYVLHGTNGSYLQKRTDQQEDLLVKGAIPSIDNWCPPLPQPDGLLCHDDEKGRMQRELTTSMPGNYMNFYTDIYTLYNNGGNNPVTGFEAANTIRIIEAALKSAELKSEILF